MNALGFFAAVYFGGLAWSLLGRSRLGIGFCCVAAYPLGLLFFVLQSLLFAFSPLPYRLGPMVATWAALFVLGVLVNVLRIGRGERATARDVALVGAVSTLFVLLALGIERINLSVLTYDSHMILLLGRSIAFHGGVAPDIGQGLQGLASRGVFQLMVQAASVFVEKPYLHSAPLIFAIASWSLFGYLGLRALGGLAPFSGRAAALVALTVCAMATPYFMLVQALYIHDNYATGMYLLFFCACFWLAEREQNPGFLPYAFGFLLAFSLQRVETPLVALMFWAIAHTQSTLPQRLLTAWFVAYASIVVLWHARLFGYVAADPDLLDPARVMLIVAATAAALPVALVVGLPRLAWLRRRVPLAILVSIGLGAIVISMLRPEQMMATGAAFLFNLQSTSWGGVWYAFPLLGILALLVPSVPFHQLFTYGAIAYLIVMFTLGLGEFSFRTGWGDSGNRMVTHVVPLLFFFFLLAYGRVLCRNVEGTGQR